MSPRTSEQNEEIRLERKTQIKQVALEIIARDGFLNSSISKIAKAAGISKGLMYNYFESKEALVVEMMMDGFSTFTDVFDTNKDGVLSDEEFHFFIDETFRILQQNPAYWSLYFTIMFNPQVSSLIMPKFMEVIEPFMATTIAYFESKGYDDPMVEARFLGATLDGLCLSYVISPADFPLDGILKKIHELYK